MSAIPSLRATAFAVAGKLNALGIVEDFRVDQSREIVEQYMSAFYSGNLEGAGAFLAKDLHWTGPGAHFKSADAFIRGSAHAAKALNGHEIKKVFVDGDDVCVFFDVLLAHQVERMAMVNWYRLSGRLIVSIYTLFDTGPFRAPTSVSTEQTAIDPVCKMSVVKAGAAATRSHEGELYYFCNPGCADAFEQNPERYLRAQQ